MEETGRDRDSQELADNLDWGRWQDWAQLVRLPNVFTVLSDSFVAVLVAGANVGIATMVLVIASSVMAYWAGMIWNDIHDLDEDRQTRSSRPLAAGKISLAVAKHIGNGFLLVCPIVILFANQLVESRPLWMGFSFFSAVLLVTCVRCYNTVVKATPVGPLLMGACRTLNILMVGLTCYSVGQDEPNARMLLWFAGAIGIYIVGVTIYARREERESSATGLMLGLGLEIVGMATIAALPLLGDATREWKIDPQRAYLLLIGLIAVTVINRGMQGVLHPVSRKVQLAVKHAILTLILLDAAVAAVFAGPWYGAAVAILLVPAITAGQWFRST